MEKFVVLIPKDHVNKFIVFYTFNDSILKAEYDGKGQITRNKIAVLVVEIQRLLSLGYDILFLGETISLDINTISKDIISVILNFTKTIEEKNLLLREKYQTINFEDLGLEILKKYYNFDINDKIQKALDSKEYILNYGAIELIL